VAILAGGLMTAFVLAAAGARHLPSISGYYADASVPMAHGRNIVNVILVDFRGLDTLGEITVLAVAGIGARALLKLRAGKGESP
jgi:multicomponent Na+:H+ antiporter subunit A